MIINGLELLIGERLNLIIVRWVYKWEETELGESDKMVDLRKLWLSRRIIRNCLQIKNTSSIFSTNSVYYPWVYS